MNAIRLVARGAGVKTRPAGSLRWRGWVSILLLLAVGFYTGGPAGGRASQPAADDIFLDTLARDTWAYLGSDWATDNHLPYGWRIEGNGGGAYANTTEMGLFALSWLAAYDLGQPWSPTWAQTEVELGAFLDQLRAWQTGSQASQPHGPNAYENKVFFQWYWIGWDPPVVGENIDGSNNQLVPAVDNAWLAASLMVIQMYAQDNGKLALAQKAADILADMDFRLWYHPDEALFTWGNVLDPQDEARHWYADTYSDENRIINFVARALGHLSEAEFRASLLAMTQESREYDGITVEKANWDGSYFTYTAPALFIREMGSSYGSGTITPATLAQMRYAQNQGYEGWGFSDCYETGPGDTTHYVQSGAPPSLVSLNEERPGLVAPFAAALALNTPYAAEAEAELAALKSEFSCLYHGTYGFHESVMAKPGDPAQHGQCSERFSALAQEWLFLSVVNYRSGFIWKYFYRYPTVMRTHCEMLGCAKEYLPAVRR